MDYIFVCAGHYGRTVFFEDFPGSGPYEGGHGEPFFVRRCHQHCVRSGHDLWNRRFLGIGNFGAAIATCVGQMVSLAVYLVMYVGKPFPVKFSGRDLRPNPPILKRLYGIGVPAILNLALPSL